MQLHARGETPLEASELAAWRGFLRAHASITRSLDAQMRRDHGLSLSAYEVLMFLDDAPARRLRMADIAERVLLTRSGCTRLVDRLVELDYVTRRTAEGDGRGLYAELTGAGAAVLGAARRTHLVGIRSHFLEPLSRTDQLVLGDIWERLLAGAGEPAQAGEREDRVRS